MLRRIAQMADAALLHLERVAEAKNDASRRAASASLSRDALLDGIHFFRVRDACEQVRRGEGEWLGRGALAGNMWGRSGCAGVQVRLFSPLSFGLASILLQGCDAAPAPFFPGVSPQGPSGGAGFRELPPASPGVFRRPLCPVHCRPHPGDRGARPPPLETAGAAGERALLPGHAAPRRRGPHQPAHHAPDLRHRDASGRAFPPSSRRRSPAGAGSGRGLAARLHLARAPGVARGRARGAPGKVAQPARRMRRV